MKPLPIPADNYADVIHSCISNITDQELRNRIIDAIPFLLDSMEDFDEKIRSRQLSTIQATDTVNGNISKAEMNNLYTNKLAKLGQPPRNAYYDRWKLITPHGRCPLCCVRDVKTLDHYLPKANYPVYSILPINLIPACRDCNTEKLNVIATCYAEETIHPYYDNIDNERWLTASIIQSSPPSFLFNVTPPNEWGEELTQRVNQHLTVFLLHDLYSSHAAEELSNIKLQLRNLFQAGGPDAVRAHLEEGYTSRMAANLNSWQTAMYEAMFEDDWFHSNGFL